MELRTRSAFSAPAFHLPPGLPLISDAALRRAYIDYAHAARLLDYARSPLGSSVRERVQRSLSAIEAELAARGLRPDAVTPPQQ